MDQKQAIEAAKASILELFMSEGAADPALEEIEFDPHRNAWLVTISYFRPRSPLEASLFDTQHLPKYRRSERVVAIDDANGRVLSVKVPAGVE